MSKKTTPPNIPSTDYIIDEKSWQPSRWSSGRAPEIYAARLNPREEPPKPIPDPTSNRIASISLRIVLADGQHIDCPVSVDELTAIMGAAQ